MLGIDVSHWQGEIDWREVRRARRDLGFAMVRLAEWRNPSPGGKGPWLDDWAVANLYQARAHGLVVGTYVRVEPTLTEPDVAALEWHTYAHLLGVVERGFMVPAFDIEDATRDWSPWVRTFITTWRQLNPQLGGRVIVYTSGSFPDGNYRTGWDRTDKTINLWLAHWTQQPGVTKYSGLPGAALHQYSSDGRVPGIDGAVDLNSTMPGRSVVELMV